MTKLCPICDKVSSIPLSRFGCNLAKVRPKTELLLYYLLWSTESLIRPTFRNLNESFEGWAYRTGLFRQVAELERQQLIERKTGDDGRIYRLTSRGRLHALGGRDPVTQWSRRWDGLWRLVLFDVPVRSNTLRSQFRRYLRRRAFGCLQKSVWITPDPIDDGFLPASSIKADVKSLICLAGRPCSGETDADLVAAAWDFKLINQKYRRHLEILKTRPGAQLTSASHSLAMTRWAEAERNAWNDAVRDDPLLPRRILPPGYLGEKAWQNRAAGFRQAHGALTTFNL
jgi:phenylacetic acid degradation operon negative regulatory protein